jgi:hypothetical protein
MAKDFYFHVLEVAMVWSLTNLFSQLQDSNDSTQQVARFLKQEDSNYSTLARIAVTSTEAKTRGLNQFVQMSF